MVTHTWEALQYRSSKDSKLPSAGIEIQTGKKWNIDKALEVAGSRLQQKALAGRVITG